MAWRRVFPAAILTGLLVACGATAAPSSAPVAPRLTPGPTQVPAASMPTLVPTLVPVPPKPTGVDLDERRREGNDPSTTEITQTVTWQAPRGEGIEIRVYGVTQCIAKPADPSPGTSGPCLVVDTPLPGSIRTLLGTAPASDGAVSWTWTGTFDCEGPGPAYDPREPAYYAVVLAAFGASGHSIFAIADPGEWYEQGPDEVVC